jgi:hypothetical protein
METQEVLDILAELQADMEWESDMHFAAGLGVAMKRVKDWERQKECIKGAKWAANHLADMNYKAGYMCALSFVEGLMAEMENEDGSN